MSHRRRGLLFAAASLTAALIAAIAVARNDQPAGVGSDGLRPVLVAASELAAGRTIRGGDLSVRRFPAAFVPPGVLSSPEQAVGERTAIATPAGAYLLPSNLGRPKDDAVDPVRRTRRRGTPVEIAVAGAGALRRSGIVGGPVDVLVTRDSLRGLGGRTMVAVESAILLALATRAGEPGESTATLGVSRAEALRLIEAESYAREIRLIAARPAR